VLGVIAEDSDLYTLFTFVGDAGMYFLPFFLAVGAAKKLNSNWGIAMYLAAIMLHPTFIDMATNGTSFTVYGIPCSVQNYSSTVMPILLAVWIMSYIEHFIKKHCPDALQIIAVPFLTALIMTPITLCVLGPIGSFASNYICGGIIKLYDIAGPLATMVIGALFLPIVFTGMHGVLYVYLFTTFPTLGYDSFFLPGVVASSWAIAGTVLATLVKFKKKSNRSFTISGFITWLVGGVGEPLMYGLLLRYRQLLYSCIISGGIAGLVAGLLHLTAYVLAPNNGIYGLFAFLGGPTSNYVALIITLAVAIGTSFAITMFMKIDEDAA
jgi:PTS system beta-glucosides-specific IIC component